MIGFLPSQPSRGNLTEILSFSILLNLGFAYQLFNFREEPHGIQINHSSLAATPILLDTI